MNKRAKSGFSLVEMLTTVAVIGVLSAIAIPAITHIDDRANQASAKRNAQEAASLSASANVLGINHVLSDSEGGVQATLQFLSEGIQKVDNSGLLVRLNLNETQIERASRFLIIKEHASYNQLTYAGNIQ